MQPILIVHGGAGDIPQSRVAGKLRGVKDAVRAGYKILENGGSALDAVEAAVASMELDDNFNAGYGSVLNLRGQVEMEASIMRGSDLNVGGVTLVKDFLHPIRIAHKVLTDSPHSLLGGEGAKLFALDKGFQPIAPESLITDHAKEALENFLKHGDHGRTEIGSPDKNMVGDHFHIPQMRDRIVTAFQHLRNMQGGSYSDASSACGDCVALMSANASAAVTLNHTSYAQSGFKGGVGTVGAVAIDAQGHVAAATSTGGMNGKAVGRIGDTPQIGSGTYADDNLGGVSITGHGESILKYCLAHSIIKLMESGSNAQTATALAVDGMTLRLKNIAGAITLSNSGDVGVHFSSKRMAWAYVKDNAIIYGIEQNQVLNEDYKTT